MSPKPHFVADYERHVAKLKASRPLEQAMSLAIGGRFVEGGDEQVELLKRFGLVDGMLVIDFGCGSGRLATALARHMDIQYAGIDVVPDLLAYAKARCPAHYRFKLHTELFFPVRPARCDFITAFSVFTHLHAHESFIYLSGMAKALKPGGAILLSFLDMSDHWDLFLGTASQASTGTLPHLNAFLSEAWIRQWADRLGLIVEAVEPGGQTLAVLRRPPD